jgi:hypothetical protein
VFSFLQFKKNAVCDARSFHLLMSFPSFWTLPHVHTIFGVFVLWPFFPLHSGDGTWIFRVQEKCTAKPTGGTSTPQH